MKNVGWFLVWLLVAAGVSAQAPFVPAPWKAGQFVVLEGRQDGAVVSTTRLLVVAADKEGWVLEMSRAGKDGRAMKMQYLLKGVDQAMAKGDVSQLGFGWMKMQQGDGPVRTLTEAQVGMFGAIAKSSLEGMVTKPAQSVDGGSVTVPAGTFSTVRVDSEVEVLGHKSKVTSWHSGQVPLNGLVKSVTGDGKTETVLKAFGGDGKTEWPAN